MRDMITITKQQLNHHYSMGNIKEQLDETDAEMTKLQKKVVENTSAIGTMETSVKRNETSIKTTKTDLADLLTQVTGMDDIVTENENKTWGC